MQPKKGGAAFQKGAIRESSQEHRAKRRETQVVCNASTGTGNNGQAPAPLAVSRVEPRAVRGRECRAAQGGTRGTTGCRRAGCHSCRRWSSSWPSIVMPHQSVCLQLFVLVLVARRQKMPIPTAKCCLCLRNVAWSSCLSAHTSTTQCRQAAVVCSSWCVFPPIFMNYAKDMNYASKRHRTNVGKLRSS